MLLKLTEKIRSLDLEPIKFKMMSEEDGAGMTLEAVNKLERQYKFFLLAIGKNPGMSIVPTKSIDEMWHYHILDTELYMAQCKEVFGRFVHHFPYFGIRNNQDAENLKSAFEKSLPIYEECSAELYGEILIKSDKAIHLLGECDPGSYCSDTGACDSGGGDKITIAGCAITQQSHSIDQMMLNRPRL